MLIVARTTAASPTREAAELPFTCSMPPMTMIYRVANPKLLDRLAVGDKVRFAADKINGSYTMPWGTTLGLVYEFDSGHAWQKRTFVPFYGYDGLAQGRGTRFMPATHYLDFHIDHTFEFRRDQSLELALDVFNLPGFAQAITYFENDTVGFGSTLYRQAPRSIRATIKYRW